MRRPQYRLRIESLRVFYNVEQDAVEVIGMIRKEDANRWLEQFGEKNDD